MDRRLSEYAWKNSIHATIGDVGMLTGPLNSIEKIQSRMVTTFNVAIIYLTI